MTRRTDVLAGLLLHMLYFTCNVYSLDRTIEAAEVDSDLKVKWHRGQYYFPLEWQRELMALTALSRVQDANFLSPKTERTVVVWERFRATGRYEVLLNMARMTNFQMYTEDWPKAWAMWGLQDFVNVYVKEARFRTYREAASKYPFDSKADSDWRLAHTRMAYITAVRWEEDLKTWSGYTKPFLNIKETVEAVLKLRDPTHYFKGDQAEGERILRDKLINTDPPTCYRQARIAIILDADFDNNIPHLLQATNDIINGIRKSTPNAVITIRGTSNMQGGFPEGGKIDGKVNLQKGSSFHDAYFYVPLSIAEFEAYEKNNVDLRARVLVIIKGVEKARGYEKGLSWGEMMKNVSIEPLYVSLTPGTDVSNFDLMAILFFETWRGISLNSADKEAGRLAVNRLLRLICQAPVQIPHDEWKQFTLFPPSANSIYDRVHFKDVSRRSIRKRRAVAFTCYSRPNCEIEVYSQVQRYVNEFYHDAAANTTIPYMGLRQFDLHVGDPIHMHFVVVPKRAGTLGVQILQYPQ